MSTVVRTTVSLLYDSVENLITCAICQCQFDNEEHQAKQLPCAHTVCLCCLQRIIHTAYPQAGASASASASASSSLLLGAVRYHISCPNCRSDCEVPRGGPQHFPSGFVVNSLRDMIANQPRELVPRCASHPQQHVLYCESCAVAFCNLCSADAHQDSDRDSTPLGPSYTAATTSHVTAGRVQHVIVNFQDALRRALGMLRHKTDARCHTLELGLHNVSKEMHRLDESAERTVQLVNALFAIVRQYVEDRQTAVVEQVRNMREQKWRLLEAQRSLIVKELASVTDCYDAAAALADVGEVTRRFVAMCDDERASGALEQPRENAFVQLDAQQFAKALHAVLTELNGLGTVRTSTAYPPLCRAVPLDPVTACFPTDSHYTTASTHPTSSAFNVACFWTSKLLITTFDYVNGAPLKTGGDPVRIEVYESSVAADGSTHDVRVDCVLNAVCDTRVDLLANGAASNADSCSNADVPTPIVTRSRLLELVDYDTGFYEATFRPTRCGVFAVHVRLFDRAIGGSPITFNVVPPQLASCELRRVGAAAKLALPNGVCVAPLQNAATFLSSAFTTSEQLREERRYVLKTRVFVLDSAQSRVTVLSLRGELEQHLELQSDLLAEQRAATGICTSPSGSLWLTNWHSRFIGELEPHSGRVLRQFTLEVFDKPALIACAADSRLYVAERPDTQCLTRGQVHVVDLLESNGATYRHTFGVTGDADGQLRVINGLCVLPNGDLVVASDCRLQVFDRDGHFRSKWTRRSNVPLPDGPTSELKKRSSTGASVHLVQSVGIGVQTLPRSGMQLAAGVNGYRRSSAQLPTVNIRTATKSRLTHAASNGNGNGNGTFTSVAVDTSGQLLATWKDGAFCSVFILTYDAASGQLELAHTIDTCAGVTNDDKRERLRRPVAIAGACLPAELADAAASERFDPRVECATSKRPVLLHLAYVVDVGDAGSPAVAILRYK